MIFETHWLSSQRQHPPQGMELVYHEWQQGRGIIRMYWVVNNRNILRLAKAKNREDLIIILEEIRLDYS